MATASAVSARKLEANRQNARKSTGPKTAEGKARSAANATVIHGFYSNRLLLDGEDPQELEQLRAELVRDLQPQGAAERLIVERLIAAYWKLRRLHEAEQRMLNQQIDSLRQHRKNSDATPAAAVAEMIYAGGEVERLSVYEKRLEGSIHRCHRELRLLRKEREQRQAEEPAEVENQREVENVRGEATAEGQTEADEVHRPDQRPLPLLNAPFSLLVSPETRRPAPLPVAGAGAEFGNLT